MRIAMISHGYYPLIGGAERQLAAVSPALQAVGVEVHILTRRHADLPAYEEIEGVAVHRLPVPGPKFTASLAFTHYGLQKIAQIRPQIIHAHELFSATTTAVRAKKRWGMPIVVTAHRSGPIGDVQRLGQKFLGHQRLRTFAREVDHFITISREIDGELMGIGVPAERLSFIPNAVDTTRFAPATAAQRATLRSQLEIPAEAEVVVFIGRLAPEKRVNHLVSLWPIIRQSHPNAHLLLLGIGPEEGKLRQMAGDGVRFCGSIDNVVPYLQTADIFCLPSVAEGLSVAMLEAMSTGLTALVTAVGGAPETITHTANGWLVPPDDVPALQQSLLTLLANPAQRASIGTAARQTVLDQFSLSSIALQLRGLYEKLFAVNHKP